jgi:hypothetical protein
MRKIILTFLILVVFISLISASDFETFFEDLETNSENYFVYYEGNNPLILSKAQEFASSFGVDVSNVLLYNKNYVAFVVPPELFGFLYFYESDFSFIQLIDEEDADILFVYLNNYNVSEEEFNLNLNNVFGVLENRDFNGENNFLVVDSSFDSEKKGVSCINFVNSSIYVKNVFEQEGEVFEDECLDDKILLKMNCEGNLIYEKILCEGYCLEGKCVEDLDSFLEVRKWVVGDKENYFKRIINFLFRK